MNDPDFETVVFTNMIKNKNMENNTPWFMSSANPLDLSLTIKGALVMYIPFLLTIAQNYNIPLSNTLAVEIVNDVSFAIAGIVIIVGLLRKLYFHFKKQ